MICDGKLIGMASPCAKGYPDVYTRIAYYVDWINDVITSNRPPRCVYRVFAKCIDKKKLKTGLDE